MLTKSLEILEVERGFRLVARQIYSEEEVTHIRSSCESEGLVVEVGPLKVSMESAGGYSHSGKLGEAGNSILYIAKRKEDAMGAILFDLKNDHVNLGKLLGYPECCIKYFDDEMKKGNFNPVFDHYNPWIDVRRRSDDVVLISHLPHSPECAESIKIAKRRFELLKEVRVEEALRFKKILGLE